MGHPSQRRRPPHVDQRNSTRRQLNRLAHLLRSVNGELGDDQLPPAEGGAFATGDRVTARAPNRDLHVDGDRHAYVRNASLGTITATRHDQKRPEEDRITVDSDGIGPIELPRTF